MCLKSILFLSICVLHVDCEASMFQSSGFHKVMHHIYIQKIKSLSHLKTLHEYIGTVYHKNCIRELLYN